MHLDGGPIFALRFTILRQFPSVFKLRLPSRQGCDLAPGFQTVVFSRRDADVLMQVLDELREGLLLNHRHGEGSEEECMAKSSRKVWCLCLVSLW
ncbi:hypothetical protein EON65_21140 [archaeon]|nr:MAG: hypothetical protein EON65_21140 [archaeon]